MRLILNIYQSVEYVTHIELFFIKTCLRKTVRKNESRTGFVICAWKYFETSSVGDICYGIVSQARARDTSFVLAFNYSHRYPHKWRVSRIVASPSVCDANREQRTNEESCCARTRTEGWNSIETDERRRAFARAKRICQGNHARGRAIDGRRVEM